MIESYRLGNNKTVPLVIRSNIESGENIFSILVGKNGTGKSTLLGNLTQEIIDERKTTNKIVVPRLQRVLDYFPKKIIAVSISPFDKFPIYKVPQKIHYTYLGLRDLNSSNYSVAYLSKIIAFLIECVSIDSNQASEIGNVLNYLGYTDEMAIKLQIVTPRGQLKDIVEFNSNETLYYDIIESGGVRGLNREFFIDDNARVDRDKISHLRRLVHDVLKNGRFPSRLEILFSRKGLSIDESDSEDILFLIHAGIFKLKDVTLYTQNRGSSFSIKKASSGEQSIILSILGIASYIKDNCLICIDEPEICLHPEWQEKFIEILTHTFKRYKHCHFVIATHSPVIVSRLPEVNSFIIDMETGLIRDAKDSINHSSDFQLANIFNFPGFKNEYLTRIALNIFSKVSKRKIFDEEDYGNFQIIDKQKHLFKKEDPVYDLYLTIKSLLEIYGRY